MPGGEVHRDFPYRVTGILAPTGTAQDRAIFGTLASVWEVHETEDRLHSAIQGTALLAGRQERETTAILLRLERPGLRLWMADEIRERSDGIAAIPINEILRFQRGIVGPVQRSLLAVAAAVVAVACLTVLTTLHQAAERRRRDIAILRSLGAVRSEVAALVFAEGLLLTGAGVALGLLLGHGGLARRGRSDPRRHRDWFSIRGACPARRWLRSAPCCVLWSGRLPVSRDLVLPAHAHCRPPPDRLNLAARRLAMHTRTRLRLLLLIAGFGIGCEQGRPDPDSSAESAAPAPTAGVPEANASESLPVIDFPLLDQVRSLDFIDMELTFPESLKELEGRRVSLVGFMAPFDSLDDMRRCMIVPSYVGCTFCSPPNLSQVVYVTQGADDARPRTYPFIEAPSHVSGILRLSRPGSDHEGHQHGFIYVLENAVVTPHTGVAPVRAAGHGTAAHEPRATTLEPVATADLVRQVADLLGRAPLHPIEIELVSAEAFGDLIRAGLETSPEAERAGRARAFSLLGLLPEDADLVDTLAEFQLARRVAATDETGERIYLIESVPETHPFVRLEMVGGIADALTRQHFPDTTGGPQESDDARRAHEALRQGLRNLTMNRYARSRGISTAVSPPLSVVQQSLVRRRGKSGMKRAFESLEFNLWQSMPGFVGTFFVETIVGVTGPLSGVDHVFDRPPSTSMEFFRPRWYQDAGLWRQDPVPADFADHVLDTPPIHTDVLGVGSLVPVLTKWYSVDVAKRLAGGWAGDRWAVWQFPDGSAALLLETRWQDEDSAIQFREAIPEHPLWRLSPHEDGSTRVQLLRADSTDAIDRLTTAVLAARTD